MLNTAHLVGAIINSVLAISATAMIYRAMHEGLTAGSNRAGIVILAAFAVGRVWHTIGEALGIPATQVIEHLIVMAGYVYFMTHVLARRPLVRQPAPDAPGGKK